MLCMEFLIAEIRKTIVIIKGLNSRWIQLRVKLVRWKTRCKNSPEAAGVVKGRQQKKSYGDRNKQEDTQTKVTPESEKKQ